MEFQPMEENFVHRRISFLPPEEDRRSERQHGKGEREKDVFLSASPKDVCGPNPDSTCRTLHPDRYTFQQVNASPHVARVFGIHTAAAD